MTWETYDRVSYNSLFLIFLWDAGLEQKMNLVTFLLSKTVVESVAILLPEALSGISEVDFWPAGKFASSARYAQIVIK
jgi:hypothetical protein